MTVSEMKFFGYDSELNKKFASSTNISEDTQVFDTLQEAQKHAQNIQNTTFWLLVKTQNGIMSQKITKT